MLNDCTYNKIKLMHELSSLVWFIQKHAIEDANEANDQACIDLLSKISKDLEGHVATLKKDTSE